MSRLGSGLRARVARLAVLVVVGALTLTGCDFSVYSLPLPGGADLGDDPYQVKVEFRDVLDLVPETSVKVDDVTVGKVDDIEVSGQHAVVTVLLRKEVKLPDNAEATIRQTSLLGEKFVSLAPPETGAASGRLSDGDTIPLQRSGRNPEVEEVLGALSLLLNGGGVAQLKTISSELNKALDGRETNVRSVLSQLDEFMGQLDTNKDQIVRAIESLNRLAVALNGQKPSITLALDELPRAVASVNRQRDDLVKMLRALSDLSSIGTQVIRDSKVATIDSLQALAPTLTKLADTGDALPKALQVFLTYPFVDAVVGTNPAQARNLHMGDYTNLSVRLDLDLNALPELPTDPCAAAGLPVNCNPGEVCKRIDTLPGPGKVVRRLCGDTLAAVQKCLSNPTQKNCTGIPKAIADTLCKGATGPLARLCGTAGGGGGGGGGGGLPLPPVPTVGPLTGSGGGGLLNRPGFGESPPAERAADSGSGNELGALLVWGMMQR
jgi:phospholipid/cholesterol/gamma-HCH transport system substrate-binding protein